MELLITWLTIVVIVSTASILVFLVEIKDTLKEDKQEKVSSEDQI